MKKLTILVSLVLCLAMMFSFTSCGGSNNGGSENKGTDKATTTAAATTATEKEPATPEELIVGAWTCELELGDFMAMAMGDTTGEYFDGLEFAIFLNMEFTEDGEVEMNVDEDTLEEAVEDLKVDLKDGMMKMLEDAAEMNNTTLDELVASVGYNTADEYIDATLDAMTAEDLLESFGDANQSGTYEIDGDKLYIVADGEDKDENNYVEFTVDEDTLTLDMPAEEKEDAEGMEAFLDLLPLRFERQ